MAGAVETTLTRGRALFWQINLGRAQPSFAENPEPAQPPRVTPQ